MAEAERRAGPAAWDEAAASFDEEPDHGLHPGPVLAAWTALLKQWLPQGTAEVVDVGCGTGSLSVVMAGLGHRVTGVDFSAAMIAKAREKTAAQGLSIDFAVMDAAELAFASGSFEGLVGRHVLWALPEPGAVLRRWAERVRPKGRLLLIEGFWETGAGLPAAEIVAALPESLKVVAVESLSERPSFWGRRVGDERYIIVAEKEAAF
jgi:SAM-dependent methyltransferase